MHMKNWPFWILQYCVYIMCSYYFIENNHEYHLAEYTWFVFIYTTMIYINGDFSNSNL